MMPAGSYLWISSTEVVHGRMALKTFCSRMRRAMSCVYWPPKSSTTTPPRSDCGLRCSSCILAPVVIVCSIAVVLGYNKIEQFIRDVNYLYQTLAFDMRSKRSILLRQCHNGIFLRASCNFQSSAHSAVDLHRDLDFVFSRKFIVMGGPARLPKSFGVAEHLPKLFGQMWSHRS